MRLGRLALVIVLAAPLTLSAQRGGGGRAERGGGGARFKLPNSSELEDRSPVGVVLDKKKKLALSDSQVTALKGVAKALHEKNADLYRMWDSVRMVMRAAAGAAFDEGGRVGARPGNGVAVNAPGGNNGGDPEQMAAARVKLQALSIALRDGDAWSRQETLKILTDEQKAKAEEFWKESAEANGMGRAPGGGRPPGE